MNALEPITDDMTTTIRVYPSAADRAYFAMEAAFAKHIRRKKAVSMAGRRRFTRAEMREGHNAELRSRRRKQLGREAGFEPVSNVAINNAFNAAFLFYQSKMHMSPVEAHNAALRSVASKLPAGRRHKAYGFRSTKQDTVEGYVKPNLQKHLRTS
jgi:hypothetical protein